MKSILSVFVVFFLCFLIQDSFAQQPVIAEPGLFRDAARPGTGAVPFPDNSGFIAINPAVFGAANAHNPEIFTIENFPLGSERVTLHVEQFDVLRKDSRLVLGTKNGDVPTATPAHVLLHGTVEGKENSHVYIAVFDGYAMGYIDASSDVRYLIQPVSLNTDMASTMIVYKQNDVARTIPEGEKWKCNTEEFAPNFTNMAKISDAMAQFSHVPEIQSQKNVNLLSIAIDCDYGFYQANGSDQTKAQNYAIAVLGAHSDIYIRDLSCGVTAGYLRVWTTKDSYSDNGNTTDQMLPSFMDFWNSEMSNVTYAAALLYGSNRDGGLAFLGQMCNVDQSGHEYAVCGLDVGYTFPRDGYVWDVDVSAHEFGHICGSLHTHNCFWAPPIDSCYASEGGCFAATVVRRGTIMSYCHLTSAGTELKFHPKVASFLKNRFNSGSITPCAASVSLPSASAGPDQVVCSGSSVSIGGNTSGGTPPFTYSWRPATGLSSTSTQVVTATPSKTTTYITTVTDANMLRSYDTVIVTVQKPTVNAGGNVKVCPTGMYTLSGSATGFPPFTYQWIDTTGNQVVGTEAKVDVPIDKTITYKLIVTDSVGCTNSVLKTISVYPAPAVPTISVAGDTLISTGATTYKWLLGSVQISGATKQRYIPVQSGNYSVRTTNQNGCDTISKPLAFTSHLGVEENPRLQSIVRLYPNPASGQVTFDYSNRGDVPLELSVTDVLGNTVYHSSRKAGENAAPLLIDISSFAQGTYFVHYSFGKTFSTLKFVKE